MIHARKKGETFGLAIGEFSLRRKPVICWFWSFYRFHIQVLGGHGIYYRTPAELYRILMSFEKSVERPDGYSERLNPHWVLEQFEAVFLS
jgi:hypothetical protein